MPRLARAEPTYKVSVDDDPDVPNALRFTFAPASHRTSQSQEYSDPQASHFIVSVCGHGTKAKFHWFEPIPPAALRNRLEENANRRVTLRHEWLDKLTQLVARVKAWADELQWATKIVDKKIDDLEIGGYKAPSLLLQQESVRLFLEPVSRTAPGTEGAVDLCLMPSYEDIASFYYYDNRWNVHYLFQGTPVVAKTREGDARPLSKATLQKIFGEMKAHAE